VKAGPPGWEPHKVMTRIDGFFLGKNEAHMPAASAEIDTVAAILARMLTRHKKVFPND
jgi:hypothetical protein